MQACASICSARIRLICWAQRTSYDGQDCFVDCLYLAGVEDVAREEGYYEEDDEDG